MTPLRDQVVAAFETDDELAVRRLNWFPVFEALATWWAPRQTCNAREAVPFAKLLGEEDPAAVLEALRDLAGDWRPHPAAVRGHLHRHDQDPARVDLGRCRDRAATPDALAAVSTALQDGEQVCGCPGRASTWNIDDASVLRCRTCAGLEQGQAYSAEDVELERERQAA